MKRPWPIVIATILAGAVLFPSGCGKHGGEPVPARTPAPSPAPSPRPEAPATEPDAPTRGIWVTFAVGEERFRASFTRADSVAYVLEFLAGRQPHRIPSGALRRGGLANAPWSWHLDPDTAEFAEFTIEVCDGTPRQVEDGLERWLSSVGRFCPWGARMVEVRDCRAGACVALAMPDE